MRLRVVLSTLGALSIGTLSLPALAQTPTPATATGQAPDEAKALVTQQGETAAPDLTRPHEGTSASVSAGGQAASGNAQLFAATANGTFDMRRGMHGFGASLLGNYAEGAPPGQSMQRTTQNLQGRARYDLYFLEEASGFLILTGRNDYFQGVDFRLNIDPGVKYLFLDSPKTKLWAEAGYDFQYQINNDDARVLMNAAGTPLSLPYVPTIYVLDKTWTDNSTRLFAGFKEAFNEEVTLSAGLEYLQSVEDATRYRVNLDALVAAKVGGGLSLGLGFSARYDHDPLPGKQTTDTATTLSLIYAFSALPEAPKPPCPCPACPPPPPPAAPAPAAAPAAPAPGPTP